MRSNSQKAASSLKKPRNPHAVPPKGVTPQPRLLKPIDASASPSNHVPQQQSLQQRLDDVFAMMVKEEEEQKKRQEGDKQKRVPQQKLLPPISLQHANQHHHHREVAPPPSIAPRPVWMPKGLMGGNASHVARCLHCQQEAQRYHENNVNHLVTEEERARERLLSLEVTEARPIIHAKSGLSLQCSAMRHEEFLVQLRKEQEVRRRHKEVAQVMASEGLARRDIVRRYENDSDDLMAFHNISLRTIFVMEDIGRAHIEREIALQQRQEADRRALEAQKHVKRLAKQREDFFRGEVEGREAIVFESEHLLEAVLLGFTGVRREVYRKLREEALRKRQLDDWERSRVLQRSSLEAEERRGREQEENDEQVLRQRFARDAAAEVAQAIEAQEQRCLRHRQEKADIEITERTQRDEATRRSLTVLHNVLCLEVEERERLEARLARKALKRARCEMRERLESHERADFAVVETDSILFEHHQARVLEEAHEVEARECVDIECDALWKSYAHQHNVERVIIALRDEARRRFECVEETARNLIAENDYDREWRELKDRMSFVAPAVTWQTAESEARRVVENDEARDWERLLMLHRAGIETVTWLESGDSGTTASPENTLVQTAGGFGVQLSQNVITYFCGSMPVCLVPNATFVPNEIVSSLTCTVSIMNPQDGDVTPTKLHLDHSRDVSRYLSTNLTFESNNTSSAEALGVRVVHFTFRYRQKTTEVTLHVHVRPAFDKINAGLMDQSGVPIVSAYPRPSLGDQASRIVFNINLEGASSDDGVFTFVAGDGYTLSSTGDLTLGKQKLGRLVGLGTTHTYLDSEFVASVLPRWEDIMARLRFRSDTRLSEMVDSRRVFKVAVQSHYKKLSKTVVEEARVPVDVAGYDPTFSSVKLWVRRTLISCRAPYLAISEKCIPYVVPSYTWLFPDTILTNGDNEEVFGGVITLTPKSGTHRSDRVGFVPKKGVLEIRNGNVIYDISSVSESVGPQPIAYLAISQPPDDVSVVITFITGERVDITAAQACIQSLVFYQVGSKASTGLRAFSLTVDIGAGGGVLERTVSAHVDNPILQSTDAIREVSYRENSPAVRAVPYEIKESEVLRCTSQAYLRIKFVEGEEFGDVLSVKGQVDTGDGLLRFDNERSTVAWFPKPKPRKPWVFLLSSTKPIDADVDIPLKVDEPHRLDLARRPNPRMNAGRINTLLRSIQYEHHTQNPRYPDKLLSIEIDDGGSTRCTLFFQIHLELTNDPIEITLDKAMLQYRQGSIDAHRGFQLFPGVVLHDPDTTDFSKGYVSVELANGGDAHDHISFLSLTQQKDLVHAEYNMPASRLIYSTLRQEFTRNKDMGNAMTLVNAVGMSTRAFELTVNEEYVFINGRRRGKVTRKSGGMRDAGVSYLRVDFDGNCDGAVLTLHELTHIVRCICYENKDVRLKVGTRHFQIAMHAMDVVPGRKMALETRTRVSVTARPPLFQLSATSFVYHERSGWKPLLRGASFGLPDNHVMADVSASVSIIGSVDPSDALKLLPEYDLRDGLVHSVVSRTNVARVVEASQTALSFVFDEAFGTTAKEAGNLLRAMCFGNDSRNPERGNRTVECVTDDGMQFRVAVTVMVESRDDPTEVTIPNERVPFVVGGPPVRVVPRCSVYDPDTSFFEDPTTLEVSFSSKGGKQMRGECFGLLPSDTISLSLLQPGSVTVLHGTVPIAMVNEPWTGGDEGVIFTGAKTLVLRILRLDLPQLEELIRSVSFSASGRAEKGTRKQINYILRTLERTTTTKFTSSLDLVSAPLDTKQCDHIIRCVPGETTFPFGSATTVLTTDSGIANVRVSVSLRPTPLNLMPGKDVVVIVPPPQWRHDATTGELWQAKNLVASVQRMSPTQLDITYINVAFAGVAQAILGMVGVQCPTLVGGEEHYVCVSVSCTVNGMEVKYCENFDIIEVGDGGGGGGGSRSRRGSLDRTSIAGSYARSQGGSSSNNTTRPRMQSMAPGAKNFSSKR